MEDWKDDGVLFISLFTVQGHTEDKGKTQTLHRVVRVVRVVRWIHLGLPELGTLRDSDSFSGSEHHFLADCVW